MTRRHSTPSSPHAAGSEAALLGAVLTCPQAAVVILTGLEEDDFHDPHHATIHAVITDLTRAGTRPETSLVWAELVRHNEVRPPDGRPWSIILADLYRTGTTPGTAAEHRRALLEARLRREALHLGQALTEHATEHALTGLWDVLNHATTALARTLARLAERPPTPALAPVTVRAQLDDAAAA